MYGGVGEYLQESRESGVGNTFVKCDKTLSVAKFVRHGDVRLEKEDGPGVSLNKVCNTPAIRVILAMGSSFFLSGELRHNPGRKRNLLL